MTSAKLPDERLNVREVLARGTQFLQSLGASAPRLEMELILAESLGISRLHLYMQMDRVLSREEREHSREMVARRRAREPIAYILGHREFYGLRFDVSPAVLIPRPETELLVDCVLAWLRARDREAAPPLLADIGTGSGAIAVAASVTMENESLPGKWIATDTSLAALEIAAANARRHGVQDRIEFREGAFFDPLDAPVDSVCSNPPYVPESERDSLAPEVRDWEPAAALFSGQSGLDHLTQIIRAAPSQLNPGGALYLEIGHGQSEHLAKIVEQTGAYERTRFHSDYASIPRVLEGHKR